MIADSGEPGQPVSAAAFGSAQEQNRALPEGLSEAAPFRPREPVDPESIRSLRARLEAGLARTRLAEEARDSVAAVLPGVLGAAMRTFDPPQLFLRAAVGHVEPGTCYSMDVAWPAKRIGIRVLGPHTGYDNHLGTAPLAVDAVMRERGWLILPVDPDAPNSVEQLERALRVVKRMGVYRR